MELQFTNACKEGNLELAQQLCYNNTINISDNNEKVFLSAFRSACSGGHLQVAQWLLSVKPDIDISADDEFTFHCTCYKGYLQVAQWLLSVKPDIVISIKYENVFRNACWNGHLQVAQWLLSVKPDINISAEGKDAFCSACYGGHLNVAQHVAQWLQTLKPHLYVINYDENGTYKSCRVRTKKEEQRFIQIIHALWLASDITPNKNNLLYQLPQDISRLIISYI